MLEFPFNPHYGTGTNVSPAAVSASSPLNSGDKVIRLRNTGATNPCQVRIGTAQMAATATAADLNIAPGETVLVYKGEGADTISYISAAGTTLSFITGSDGT